MQRDSGGLFDAPEQQLSRLRSLALKLLARREHSRAELTQKLQQRGFDADMIHSVLDDFCSSGWLSDERYVQMRSRQRRSSGYGPLYIQAELQSKGIDKPLIQDADLSDEGLWRQAALSARARKFGLSQERLPREDWLKQAQFLARRGFSEPQIRYALDYRGDLLPSS